MADTFEFSAGSAGEEPVAVPGMARSANAWCVWGVGEGEPQIHSLEGPDQRKAGTLGSADETGLMQILFLPQTTEDENQALCKFPRLILGEAPATRIAFLHATPPTITALCTFCTSNCSFTSLPLAASCSLIHMHDFPVPESACVLLWPSGLQSRARPAFGDTGHRTSLCAPNLPWALGLQTLNWM